MKKQVLTLMIACAITASYSVSGYAQDSKKSAKEKNEKKFEDTKIESDAEFAVNTAESGMFEVKVSELAQTKSSTPAVKELATKMIADHSKLNSELKTVAAKKNITLPTMITSDHQEKYNELAGKSGIEFDKAYTELLVDSHKKAIDRFEKESDKGKDTDLRGWAGGKIPTLKHHLMMAESTHETVKKLD